MPRSDIHFPPKDEPLRDDVRTFGAMVGEILREQGGEALFEAVEGARTRAIRRREGDGAAGDELRRRLAKLSADEGAELVRAFSTYFQVVNLAEKVHRIRRRRDYLRSDEGPQPGGLEDSLRRLADTGLDAAGAAALLARLGVEPVFTAHPTEATRRTLLEKQQRIARSMVDRLDPSRTPDEESAAVARVRAEVTSSWQTEESPGERPTVMDEVEHVLFFLTDVIYRVVPPFYESLDQALEAVWGQAGRELEIPPLLSFGSWVGGDMDGNPNVDHTTLLAALGRQRELVLKLYRRELLGLYRRLSQSRSRVAVDPAVEERIAEYERLLPETADTVPRRHREMPYRVFLTYVSARLDATAEDGAAAYDSPDGLLADLGLIADSLAAHRGRRAGRFAVRRAIARAATFGFHLATLDVRQDALVHRRVVGRLLGEEAWEGLDADERAGRLRRALDSGGPEPPVAPGDDDRATLDVFAAIAEARRRFGARAVGPYVISMARGVDDVLSVLLLARWGGLAQGSAAPLDVAPLFETVTDLESAPRVMSALLADPLYRRHLEERGERQTVMVGYSDSGKDGGLAAARWGLQRAQAALVDAFRDSGVALTVFHGRGGTVSRGGGPVERAVLAAPAGSVDGRLRLTEQGEVINEKYGLRGIAIRTLERTVAATAVATALPPEPPGEDRRRLMDHLAADSRASWRRLVYGDGAADPGAGERFHEFFRAATPIDVIERMPIGSRPASRRQGRGIEDLRAIPWVFAWTQSRFLLPAWLGLGRGLAAAVERHGEEELARLARGWPFLRNLLGDAETALAIADLDIAGRYAELAGEAGAPLFAEIRAEHDRTVELVLRLTGHDELLADEPTLKRAIRLRNPYVDPMSLLQVDLLERWRAGGRENDDLLAALFATVHGIAEGLQSTG